MCSPNIFHAINTLYYTILILHIRAVTWKSSTHLSTELRKQFSISLKLSQKKKKIVMTLSKRKELVTLFIFTLKKHSLKSHVMAEMYSSTKITTHGNPIIYYMSTKDCILLKSREIQCRTYFF